MILLVHMLFGAAIGASVQNIPLAIILALLGHYFLDLFPHIEYLAGVEDSITGIKKTRWQKNVFNILKVFIDFCLGLALIFLFSNPSTGSGQENQLILYTCALVAIIPDGLTVIHSLLPNLGLAPHHNIHSGKIHYLTKQKKFPIFWKIATQVIATVISVFILAH